MPVVRYATLLRHDPQLVTAETVGVAEAMSAIWPEWKDRYAAAIAALAERVGISASGVAINSHEEVRYRLDGKTPMIDLPEAVIQRNSQNISLRNCAALCVHDFSSKVWTRINGLGPEGHEVESLGRVLHDYRALAKSCGDWFQSEVENIAGDLLAPTRTVNDGVLEITTVGLRVKKTDHQAEDFESWLFDSAGGPNFANEEFCDFMSEAAALTDDVRTITKKQPTAFWMSMPMAVRMVNGDLASRSTMYLVRTIDDMIQAVGIGLDDSEAGDLASEVALKVSRVLANRL